MLPSREDEVVLVDHTIEDEVVLNHTDEVVLDHSMIFEGKSRQRHLRREKAVEHINILCEVAVKKYRVKWR